MLCTRCEKDKDLEEFALRGKTRPGKRHSHCKQCRRETNNLANWNLKLEVLLHYGNQCACCGEKERLFLVIDHVDNNGAEQRKQLGFTGTKFYQWLKKSNWPDRLQVLCFNCNMGKELNEGVCPHQIL